MGQKTIFTTYKPRTIINKHKRPDPWFWIRYSAYPYIGCQHGCEFCYCRERKYAPYEDIKDFPYHIKVKENTPELMRKALSKAERDTIAVGDYQPVERKFMLSRRMLEICLELDFPVFVLERSPLVTRDLDLLQEINRRTHASVVFSVIHTSRSPHAETISRLERLAPAPEKRFDAMEKIAALGIRTGICFMPILPDLCDTDENIENVIKATADHGGQFVLAGPLTLADQQKTYFFNHLQANYPHLYAAFLDYYPQKSYGPIGDTWLKAGRKVREVCQKIGIPDRKPRPIIPGEKRALNKRAAELLSDKTYTMELEGEPDFRIWPYRKAAWALEDLRQDIGLVYEKMGAKGLQSIENIGPSIAKQLENWIRQSTDSEIQGNHTPSTNIPI